MRKKSEAYKGSIICTASNAGLYPFPIAPMYGTSKHGVVGAVRSLAKPLDAEGIQINAICPNVIGTTSPSPFRTRQGLMMIQRLDLQTTIFFLQ